MLNRNRVESLLKVNGISPTSPDEVIRSVLLSARYTEDEVESAITILRENVKTNKSRVDGLHKVFRTDQTLKPKEISDLLGIDLSISDTVVRGGKPRRIQGSQFVAVCILSVVLALCGVLLYMFLFKVGLFYEV